MKTERNPFKYVPKASGIVEANLSAEILSNSNIYAEVYNMFTLQHLVPVSRSSSTAVAAFVQQSAAPYLEIQTI